MSIAASVQDRFRGIPSGFSTYWPGFAVTAAVAAWAIPIAALVDSIVPDAYMVSPLVRICICLGFSFLCPSF